MVLENPFSGHKAKSIENEEEENGGIKLQELPSANEKDKSNRASNFAPTRPGMQGIRSRNNQTPQTQLAQESRNSMDRSGATPTTTPTPLPAMSSMTSEDKRMYMQVVSKAEPKIWEPYARFALPILCLTSTVFFLISICTSYWMTYNGAVPSSGTIPVRLGLWSYCSEDKTLSSGEVVCSRISIHCHANQCRTQCLNDCVSSCENLVIFHIPDCSSFISVVALSMASLILSIIGTTFLGVAYVTSYSDKFGTLAGIFQISSALLGMVTMSVFLGNVFFEAGNNDVYELDYSFYLLMVAWILALPSGVVMLLLFQLKFNINPQLLTGTNNLSRSMWSNHTGTI